MDLLLCLYIISKNTRHYICAYNEKNIMSPSEPIHA